MAPNVVGSTFILAETALTDTNNNNKVTSSPPTPPNDLLPPTVNSKRFDLSSDEVSTREKEHLKKPYKVEIVWRNVIAFIILHTGAFYGLYLVFAELAILEFLFGYFLTFLGGIGITGGAHRLWAHRSYKAKLPLRIILMVFDTLAFQDSIYVWARDHRVHHKFTDTNADPYSSRRGFFFSHMGWLMCRKHPDVVEKGKLIDLSDLEADPVIRFQRKYFVMLMPLFCFVLPAIIPYLAWGAPLMRSFFICSVLRYTISLHGTWTVNSIAHIYGTKPYDKNISPVESKLVSIVALGEGWHNYHHIFPWDYKAAELGRYPNVTVTILNLLAKIGQAYDMKTVSREMILRRTKRTGDGSYPFVLKDLNNNEPETTNVPADMLSQLDHEKEKVFIWGWDDKDISEDDRNLVHILDKKDI
ncbi:stearoyl-CoA desaturase 5-like [Glossina fuscipes]|uniref:Stearoyl-CoA desaturase 5-like n=1 Tax=Glossina fuscipes TaxID=7396 RepID=A0A9C5ZCS5_9MUSC|nr:stearoyl-CoA desaturase 5-like [Glossina fuscipes]XP_037899325.1 stearoyl-CoA desaturase 5-like [Glossina fuscipes]